MVFAMEEKADIINLSLLMKDNNKTATFKSLIYMITIIFVPIIGTKFLLI